APDVAGVATFEVVLDLAGAATFDVALDLAGAATFDVAVVFEVAFDVPVMDAAKYFSCQSGIVGRHV
ncbi:hypothetical protein QN379_21160, partial [Glaciimonas sp. Gout2]